MAFEFFTDDGPLHAFFVRIRGRRGQQSCGSQLAVLCWQQDPRDATSSRTSATEGQPA
jgi:hypothetical protein